jgi:RNA polymerase sporulation-specific sigma factor
MAHPQGVDAVWNDCAGRSGMEKYRDNDPGKGQTAYDRLSDEALLRQLRAGDAAIMDYVLDKYKPLVRKKANAMFLIGGDTDDLIQEGMIGLFKAIRDYREERETSFFHFAE